MPLRERVAGFKPGLVIGDHTNNQDFWGISFGRPTAFLLLLLVGDLRWVTPNRITHLSNLLLVAGCAAMLQVTRGWFVVAAVLLNLSLTFDCADGQLARYRRSGSELGSYYDKASDALGMVILFAVAGWVAHQRHGDPALIVLALFAVGGHLTSGYVKWLARAAQGRGGKAPAPATPPAVPIPLYQYPPRVLLKVFRFAEPDLLFWLSLGLLLDRLDLAVWLAGITQLAMGVGASFVRGIEVARLDRR
jgi:phosphatidylglycerophosphate synthase